MVVTYTTLTGTAIWTSDSGTAQNFLASSKGIIDGYGETKAFFLAPQGMKTHLRDIFVTAKASGDYNLDVGINGGEYDSYIESSINLSSGGDLLGSTFIIGQSVLGGKTNTYSLNNVQGFRERTVKFRFRNNKYNQPFTVYGFRARYQVINKFR
jgi:hypothetical protein